MTAWSLATEVWEAEKSDPVPTRKECETAGLAMKRH